MASAESVHADRLAPALIARGIDSALANAPIDLPADVETVVRQLS